MQLMLAFKVTSVVVFFTAALRQSLKHSGYPPVCHVKGTTLASCSQSLLPSHDADHFCSQRVRAKVSHSGGCARTEEVCGVTRDTLVCMPRREWVRYRASAKEYFFQ